MRRKQQTKVNNPLDDIEALLASICNHNNGTNCVTNSEVSKSPARRQTPESWAQQVSLSPEPSSKHTRLNKTARRTSTAAARKKKSKSHISSKRVVKSSNASAIRSSCWKAQKRPSTVTLLPNDSESSGESADGNKQAHTSSDDGENRVFLEKMKSLAQEKLMVSFGLFLCDTLRKPDLQLLTWSLLLQVEKRKMEAKRLKTIENMDELTAKSELRMKQVAGAVSKQIMRYTNSMKREMPDNCKKIISENQVCIATANKAPYCTQ